jgi:hypothetical protein
MESLIKSLKKDLKNSIENHFNQLETGDILLESKQNLEASLHDNEVIRNLNQQLQLVNKVLPTSLHAI